MIVISYDIADDKKRTKFSNFLSQYGYRLQYSVFQIRNSQRVLKNIIAEIKIKYQKKFDQHDSIYIFQICEGCKAKTIRYGYARHEESEVVFFS